MKKKITGKKVEYFDDWLKEQLKDKEFFKVYKAEQLRASIGVMVQEARRKRHISQKGLAKLLDMSQAEISRIESGDQNITVDTLGKIAAGLKAKAEVKIAV